MFKEERNESNFEWSMLGDIHEGRPNLGNQTTVDIYRLMHFTLRDVMIQHLGVLKTDEIFFQAGEKAGRELYKHRITCKDTFNEFIADLQKTLKDLGIGILRIESSDLESLTFTLTVAEDLDCSGLPVCGEEICVYDEGFIKGILSEHTGRDFHVKEVDCWCSGDRVCRYNVTPAA